MRERWLPTIANTKSASATKSRSDTPSMLFAAEDAKPSAVAVFSGESGSEDPASAPEPSGLTEVRTSQSEIRSRSRANA